MSTLLTLLLSSGSSVKMWILIVEDNTISFLQLLSTYGEYDHEYEYNQNININIQADREKEITIEHLADIDR